MTATANDIQAVSDAVLDFEYLKILRIMKPYITCIMNSHYIELIRHWLEKLSEPNYDKIQRNVYLFQLGKQIEEGDFSEPFLEPPPNGSLKPYQEQWGDVLADEQEMKSSEMAEEEEKVLWQYFPFTKSSLTYTAWNTDLENTKKTNKFFQQLNSKADDVLNQLESSVLPKLNNITSNDAHWKNRQNNIIANSDCLQSTNASPIRNINPSTENDRNINISRSSRNKLNEMREKLNKFEANVLNIQRNIEGTNKKKQRTIKIDKPTDINNNVSAYVMQNSELFRLNLAGIYQSQSPMKRDDESSWYDMSEGSTNNTCQGSGDAPISMRAEIGDSQNQKVTELLEIIDELRRDNFILGQQLEKCTKYSNAQNSATELSIQNLVQEVGSLKNRLQELLGIKSNMQNNHMQVSANLQSNIANLHKKLKNIQKKNQDLKMVITALEEQLKEEQEKNEKVTKEIKSKISTSALKELEHRLTETISKKEVEIANINAKYENEIQQKNDDFQQELLKIQSEKYEAAKQFDDHSRDITNTYESKIIQIKDTYEKNIVDLKNEFRTDLNGKENEIERLELLVQDQCGRMRNEVQQIRKQLEEASKAENEELYLEKIEFLQKCILKMEKLYLKSEKDFHKQLSKLRKDLELRDKQNQLQLHTQKAGLITNKHAANLADIDDIINKLEKYYKSLILKQQDQATDERRRDAKIISELRGQLL